MTRKTVTITWHRKVTLTIDGDGFGVLDDQAKLAFTEGQCHALAIALNSLTGWTIKGLGNPYYDSPRSPSHVVVYSSKLRLYVDIEGAWGRSGLRANSNKVVNRNVSTSLARCLDNYLKPNVQAAMPFAKSILRTLGEL